MYYKLLVVDIDGEFAYGLTDQGEILKIKKKEGMEEGQKIFVVDEDIINDKNDSKVLSLERQRKKKEKKQGKKAKAKGFNLKPLLAVAAAFLLIVTSIINTNNVAYAKYTSIESEETIQLETNRRGKVVNVFDQEGNIIEDSPLLGEDLNTAINQVMSEQIENSEENIIITTSGKNDQQKQNINMQCANIAEEKGYSGDLIFLDGSEEDFQEARRNNTSFSRHIANKNNIDLWKRSENQKINPEEKEQRLKGMGVHREIGGRQNNQNKDKQDIKENNNNNDNNSSPKINKPEENNYYKDNSRKATENVNKDNSENNSDQRKIQEKTSEKRDGRSSRNKDNRSNPESMKKNRKK